MARSVEHAQSDLAEADQDRQRDTAELQIVDQLFEIESAIRILVRVDPQMPVGVNREVALAPARDVKHLVGVMETPGFGGFQNGRCLAAVFFQFFS